MKFFGILLFILTSISFPNLVIKDKIDLNISIDREGLPALFYIDPPVNICEGINNEIMVIHKTFFEIFNSNGEKQKKVGAKGEGPGDFSNIMSWRKKNNRYYFLDYPATISIFDHNFKFVRKIRLGGARSSPFVQSFDINNDIFYCAQNYSQAKNNKSGIIKYLKDGKMISHFFDQENGWKIYPLLSLVAGRICVLSNNIYFSYFPTPKIYRVTLKGKIVDKVKFGEKWWKRIIYNEDEFKKKERKSSTKAYAELLTSGDRIIKLAEWRGNLLVHIVKDPAEDYLKHGFVIFSADLKKKTEFITMKDYQFSGSGRFIYFSRELEDYELKDKIKIEVLKCDLEF